MKKQLGHLLPAALISLLFVVSALPSALPRETCDHSKWLQASLEEIEAIRAGMTRRDLMKLFRAQGGIFTRTQQQFVYRKSPLIHVTVKFEAVGRPDITAPEEADIGDDRIVEISRPFIENEILD
jgi:hypothetical protein